MEHFSLPSVSVFPQNRTVTNSFQLHWKDTAERYFSNMLAGRDLDPNAVGRPPVADRLTTMCFQESSVVAQYMKKDWLQQSYTDSDQSSLTCVNMGPHMILAGYARR